MQLPLQIHFQNLERSEAIEAAVRKRADKLERFADTIISCRVTVEAPHRHHHRGKLYHVVIDLRTPGGEIAVSRMPDDEHAHEDVYVAIRDAFDAARRQVQDFARRQRGDVKHHEESPHGKILEVVPMRDCGTIESADGREIYFHRNSVVDAEFDQLEEGAEVRFSAAQGEKGLQATTVHVVGKQHTAEP